MSEISIKEFETEKLTKVEVDSNLNFNSILLSHNNVNYGTNVFYSTDIQLDSRRSGKWNYREGWRAVGVIDRGISKIGESDFNDTIRIPEFAFWVTCRSFKGERAREASSYSSIRNTRLQASFSKGERTEQEN